MDVTAAVGAQAATLLRADAHHQPLAGQVAELLEHSVLGERCLLNLALCKAAALALAEIAETALPAAVHAGELAEIFRARYRAAS